jgi:GT2 family glycosyltransferase
VNDLSIVIVSWNCKQLLAGCLTSLRDHLPTRPKELIIVDNASSDGTPGMIRRDFPEVVLIEGGSNLGFARGNNLGLAASTGQYICLINPDVEVTKECIPAMRGYMDTHREAGMLGPQIIGPDGLVQRSCMREPTFWNQFCRALALDTLAGPSALFGGYLMNDFAHAHLREVPIINGCFWMVRREALLQVGTLDDRFWMYGEDVDWCRRFRCAGWKVVFYPEAKAIHYGGGSSKNSSSSSYIQMQRANLQYWRKYHGATSSLFYWCLLSFGHLLRSLLLSAAYVTASSGRSHLRTRLAQHLSAMHHLLFEDSLTPFRYRDKKHV